MLPAWLAILLAVEIGSVPASTWYLYSENDHIEPTAAYSMIDITAEIGDHAFISSEIRTDMRTSENITFDPFWTTYMTSAGATWGPFEVGGRYSCTHPIMTYLPVRDHAPPAIEGAYVELYGRLEVRF